MDHLKLAAIMGAHSSNPQQAAILKAAALYAKPLTEQMRAFEILSDDRVAAFLANVRHETGSLLAVEEDLTYRSPARLREIFPSLFVPPKGKLIAEEYVASSAKLSKARYKGFHGRGLMHLTWEENYAAAGKALGFDYVKNPALVMQPWHACATAAWFWASFRGLNALADHGDMFRIRQVVNGDRALGLVETKRYRVAALAELRTA
jgi:putative chitinase